QDGDFRLELRDSSGGSRLVYNGFFGFLDLFIRCIVELIDVIRGETRDGLENVILNGCAPFEDLFFTEPTFESFAAPFQRLIDRFRRRGQSALKDRESEADRAFASLVLQRVGAVELVADVVGHLPIQGCLGIRKLVADRIGPALREERGPVELQKLLLY